MEEKYNTSETMPAGYTTLENHGDGLQYLRKIRQREITISMTSPDVYRVGLFTRWLCSVNICRAHQVEIMKILDEAYILVRFVSVK